MVQNDFMKNMHEMFATVETRFKPDLRWWLAEGLNTDETLRKNVKQIAESGFGAAEFLAMPEPHADSSIYGWGSDEWTADTKLIMKEATERGLGFSLTSGAHWATANLPDTYTWGGEVYGPDHKAASKELDYATIMLEPGELFAGPLPTPPHPLSVGGDAHGGKANYKVNVFQGVAAARVLQPRYECGQRFDYRKGFGTGVLDAGSLVDLTDSVRQTEDGYVLEYRAPEDGKYVLFAYWMHGTCQTASPSVATNYAINYMDRYGIDAFKDYWEENVLTEELRETITRNGRGEIYMDSIELQTYGAGGLFWGYDFKDEFQKRMGYDLTAYLPLITVNRGRVESRRPRDYDYTAPGAEDLIRRVRNDYYRVMSEMYVENILTPLSDWLHSMGMTLRAEPSYGTNFEISTPARAIDGIETESFAQTADIDLYRGISGSAHMYGRIFSSETGAVYGHNYYFDMDTWTSLCYLQFAEGVNRTVFHGYSAIEGSPEDTFWPGHEGMYPKFSERFNCRQPASVHYPEWTMMLGRVQKAMRQGTVQRDLAILRTDYFFVNYGKPKGYDDFRKGFMMFDQAYYWKDQTLQQAGYTYEYFSPQLLLDHGNVRWNAEALQPDGPAYRAVLLYQEDLELDCARKLLEIAESGLRIIFVNHNTETTCHQAPDIYHVKAASKSKSLSCTDEELAAVVDRIKALDNVFEANSPADVPALLRKLGILPRAMYGQPNNRILTNSRLDRDSKRLYTFVYDYKYYVLRGADPIDFTLSLEGEGRPYLIDPWNGEVTEAPAYRIGDGRTEISLRTTPGEARLIVLDLTDAAPCTRTPAGLSRKILPLENWDIEVEDWNEGDQVINTEEKFGHVTREAYYTTRKTLLHWPSSSLAAWKDLPLEGENAALLGPGASMSHVSGIGRYDTEIDWQPAEGRTYLAFGEDGGGTVEVWINGCKAGLVPHRIRRIDVTDYLKPGINHIHVEAASTLTNRMLQRHYETKNSGWTNDFPTVQAYGIRDVRLETEY